MLGAAKVFRVLLIVCAVSLTVWAFARVGVREFGKLIAVRDADTIELSVMHWSGGGGQQEDQIVEDTLRAFEERNPGIRIKRINPGDTGQFFTKLQTMMSAGDPPDLFYMNFEQLPIFAAAGQLAQLESVVDVEKYFAPAMDAFRYDGRVQGKGALFGVPKDFTTVGFYYNKSLFAQAGVAQPAAGWTWDDFHAGAQAIGALGENTTGAEIVTWGWILRVFLWTHGVDIFDDTGQLALDDPAVEAAFETLRAWRFDEHGTLLGAEAEGIDPGSLFLTGKLGMVGPFGRWVVPSYREIPSAADGGFEWGFAPLPRGAEDANIIATAAWSLGAKSRHPEAARKLLRWLVGEETQAAQSRLGLAIPSLRSVAESDAFIDATVAPADDQAYLDAVANARVATWPQDPEFVAQFEQHMNLALRTGRPVRESLDSFSHWWRVKSASPLARNDFPLMRWSIPIVVSIVLIVLLIVAAILVRSREKLSRAALAEERSGYALASPWLLGAAFFLAGPIVVSLLLSLTKWNGLGPLGTAQFVGVANFQRMFTEDQTFWASLRVTGLYVLFAVVGGQAFALLAAVLLNARLRGIDFFRAAWYLPSVLAGVGMSVLFLWVFKSDGGLMNTILAPLLAPFGLEPPEWFNRDARTFGVPAFAIMNMWLIGGSMMIYLAGLRNIPEELYEAASIDGARGWTRFVRITLPMLGPVVLFNGVMAIIGSFQVFTQAFVMTGGGPGDDTRFYVLYLYNKAFDYYDMGYASALAWLLLVVVLLLTGLVLRGSRRFVHYEGLRP